MAIWISDHARRRLLRRRVSMEDVEYIVENPEDRLERDDGCCEYSGTARGRRLLIVVDEGQDPPALVTVHTLPRR